VAQPVEGDVEAVLGAERGEGLPHAFGHHRRSKGIHDDRRVVVLGDPERE
jgi:hypothetical protein